MSNRGRGLHDIVTDLAERIDDIPIWVPVVHLVQLRDFPVVAELGCDLLDERVEIGRRVTGCYV